MMPTQGLRGQVNNVRERSEVPAQRPKPSTNASVPVCLWISNSVLTKRQVFRVENSDCIDEYRIISLEVFLKFRK